MRIARASRTVLYIAVACLIIVSVASRPIAWAEPQYDAAIVFTGITSDENGVTLSGTVTSTGTDPLYRVQVVLWRDRTPLRTRDQLDEALAADPNADTGDRIDTTSTATQHRDSRRMFGDDLLQPG